MQISRLDGILAPLLLPPLTEWRQIGCVPHPFNWASIRRFSVLAGCDVGRGTEFVVS